MKCKNQDYTKLPFPKKLSTICIFASSALFIGVSPSFLLFFINPFQIGVSADKMAGNKNHEVERTVDAAWTAVGIATLKMPTNFKEHIEFFGTMVQVKSTMSNVNQNSEQNKKSASNNPDKSQNNNKKVKSYDTKKDNH